MLLTDEERKKFVAYLRQDIMSNEAIVRQMEKLPFTGPLINERKSLINAEIIVANMLEGFESQTISV